MIYSIQHYCCHCQTFFFHHHHPIIIIVNMLYVGSLARIPVRAAWGMCHVHQFGIYPSPHGLMGGYTKTILVKNNTTLVTCLLKPLTVERCGSPAATKTLVFCMKKRFTASHFSKISEGMLSKKQEEGADCC